MAPEIVDDDGNMEVVNGKKVKRKRGKVSLAPIHVPTPTPTPTPTPSQITTGKLGIDLERTLVIHSEKDPSIWSREVDPQDIAAARRFAAPERKQLRGQVRSALDSLISGGQGLGSLCPAHASIPALCPTPASSAQDVKPAT